jgi:hypothetical protein
VFSSSAIVARLGHSGCYLIGKEISVTLGRDRGLVYGNVRIGEWNHLDIGEENAPMELLDEFPNGWYDGDGPGLKLDALDIDINDIFIFRGAAEDREKMGHIMLRLETTRQRIDTGVKAKRERKRSCRVDSGRGWPVHHVGSFLCIPRIFTSAG